MKWIGFFRISIVIIITAVLFGGEFFLVRSANVSTKVITTEAVLNLSQGNYRWYENIDALTPTNPLAAEDTAISTPAAGTVLRLRLNAADGGVDLSSGTTFKLQYSNSTSGGWTDISTSTAWVFFDNPSVADGQIILTNVLSDSNVGESYDESNPSAATPNAILQNQVGEWDWVIENNSAATGSNWFFRMIFSSSTPLDAYSNYPKLSAVSPSQGGGGGGSVGVGAGQINPPPVNPPPTSTGTPPVSAGPTSTPPGQEKPPGLCSSHLPTAPPLLPAAAQIVDFNCDSHIDMVDLSVLLYFYGESGSDVIRYDLNRNGLVDFPDVSIMMFYWTDNAI